MSSCTRCCQNREWIKYTLHIILFRDDWSLHQVDYLNELAGKEFLTLGLKNNFFLIVFWRELFLIWALISEISRKENLKSSAKYLIYMLKLIDYSDCHFDVSQSVLKFLNQLSFEINFHFIQHQQSVPIIRLVSDLFPRCLPNFW